MKQTAKKQYVIPEVKVVELLHRTNLLQDSPNGPGQDVIDFIIKD